MQAAGRTSWTRGHFHWISGSEEFSKLQKAVGTACRQPGGVGLGSSARGGAGDEMKRVRAQLQTTSNTGSGAQPPGTGSFKVMGVMGSFKAGGWPDPYLAGKGLYKLLMCHLELFLQEHIRGGG